MLLPVGQLHTGKDETHGIERDNARQRHWLARFRRRSIVVSKAKRMVDVSIALFARFAGNNKIGDLISMLALNPPNKCPQPRARSSTMASASRLGRRRSGASSSGG